jgi:basic membrane protein A and related proteins
MRQRGSVHLARCGLHTLSILAFCAHSATPLPTKPSVITTGRPEPVPIAFVYRDGAGDSAWSESHEIARKAIATEFGARVQTVAVENVATASDADRVFRDLAAKGYKVFFATDPAHSDAAARVAAADYDIKVEQAVRGQTLINMRTYEIRQFEQAYLAGIIAAGSSATRKLGFIAPYDSPETRLQINAFALGARSVDEKAITQVVWLGSRSNAAGEVAAAEGLIRQGADVLLSIADGAVSAQVAERAYGRKRNVRFIGWHVDRSAVAPNAQVAALTLNWIPFYKTAVQESFDYLCTKTDTSRGYRDDAIRVTNLAHSSLRRRATERLAIVQTQLTRDEFQVFTGPIQSDVGLEVLPPGAAASEAWRTSMNFLVRGVTVLQVTGATIAPQRWGKS